jgi:hypothetical protein
MVHDRGFCTREFVQGSKTLFAPVATFADSAEGQLDPGPRTKTIDEDLPCPNPLCHANLTGTILCPDCGYKSVFSGVGKGDCVGFIGER